MKKKIYPFFLYTLITGRKFKPQYLANESFAKFQFRLFLDVYTSFEQDYMTKIEKSKFTNI